MCNLIETLQHLLTKTSVPLMFVQNFKLMSNNEKIKTKVKSIEFAITPASDIINSTINVSFHLSVLALSAVW